VLSSYPLFFILAGFAASALLYRRALALMQADDKAVLVDSSARSNLLNLLVMGLFVPLVLWRPVFGWLFLGIAYLGLGVRSALRLRRLKLPARAARLLLMGNLAVVAGIAVCASILALRGFPWR
jgi:hypothetical protein